MTAQQRAAVQHRDEVLLAGFVDKSKASFMSGMHVTSFFAGLAALLGAGLAFAFLPSRREYETSRQPHRPAVPEPEGALAP